MRKLKFNLGDGGIKGFLIRHVEKMVLLTAVVLVGVFFSLGYFAEGLPDGKTPSALKDQIIRVRSHINADTWAKLAPVRTPDLRHPERVDEGRKANEDRSFPLASLHPPALRQKTLRSDPRLFKPIKVEVVAKTVPLAYFPGKSEFDQIANEPLATVKKKAEKSTTAPKPKKGEVSADVLSGYPMPMPEGGAPSSGSDASSGAGVYGGVGSGIEEYRQLSPTQDAKLAGYIPATEAIAKSTFLVAIKAVVPYEQQYREFERCFSNSNEYDLERDVPVYRWFYVERAEVPADPDAELVWTRLNTKQIWDLANPELRGSWAGTAEEIADYDFVDEVLTLPIPPVLMDGLKKWALHSEVPERKDVMFEDGEEEMPAESSGEDGPDGPSSGRDRTTDGAAGAGMPGGRPGGPGPRGPRSQPGIPGMTPGMMPGMPGMGRGSRSGAGAGAMTPGMPGMGRGARPGGAGMMPGMDGFGTSAAEVPLPKYKLIRFYDLKTEPGKTYRYRVQVQLFDPNRTDDPAYDPSLPTLDPAVVARVKGLDAKEGSERKTYWIDSEWSDESEAVHVPPSPQQLLAGSVVPAKETVLQTVGGNRLTAPRFVEREPHATVAASIWDDKRAARVAVELPELYRGSVLNSKIDVDVLHPITRQFHTLEKYSFATDSVLLDIRGGDLLPGQRSDSENPFHVPGEFLLVDKYGNLLVGDEFEDIENYRQELFIEDTPPTATGSMGSMPSGASTPMMPGMPGYDSPDGPGKNKKAGKKGVPSSGPPGMVPSSSSMPMAPGPTGPKPSSKGRR